VLVPLITLVIKNSPRDIGTLPDGEKYNAPGKHQRTPLPESNIHIQNIQRWTLIKALQTSVFWILALAFSMVFLGTASVIAHAVPFFVEQGFSNQLASTILGSAVGVSILGRIITGYLSDKMPVKYVAVLFFLLHTAGLLVLILPTTPISLLAFIAIFGLAMGGLFVLEPLVIREYFGLGSFGAIYGGLWAFETLGWAAGPYVTGYIFDMTGNYNLAFIIFISVSLLAAALMMIVRRPRP
jgi:sugar phosphate permease